MSPFLHSSLSRRDTLGAATVGATLAAATISGAPGARAQATHKATFVLVHPAWHGGWCWKKVKPLLQAKGHDVHTPTLTGLGERSHLAHPGVGLETHIEDVLNVLKYEDLSRIILVGHSSSGVVITGVADRAPEQLAHLVYLDAFVPENGQSMMDMIPPNRLQGIEARVQSEGKGWLLTSLAPAPWDQFVRDAWGVTDEADRRWMVARLGPTPFKHFKDQVRRTNADAEKLPRTYIRCLQWQNPTYDRYAEAARKGGVWRYRELATSHEPFITMPRELADLFLEIAA
jgi:pimeloyl-ACP methyl ester carboxylesterase